MALDLTTKINAKEFYDIWLQGLKTPTYIPDELRQEIEKMAKQEHTVSLDELKSAKFITAKDALRIMSVTDEKGQLQNSWKYSSLQKMLEDQIKAVKQQATLQEKEKKIAKAEKRAEIKQRLDEIKRQHQEKVVMSRRRSEELQRGREFIKTLREQKNVTTPAKPQSPTRPPKIDLVV